MLLGLTFNGDMVPLSLESMPQETSRAKAAR
jgi:hypothetical protein